MLTCSPHTCHQRLPPACFERTPPPALTRASPSCFQDAAARLHTGPPAVPLPPGGRGSATAAGSDRHRPAAVAPLPVGGARATPPHWPLRRSGRRSRQRAARRGGPRHGMRALFGVRDGGGTEGQSCRGCGKGKKKELTCGPARSWYREQYIVWMGAEELKVNLDE